MAIPLIRELFQVLLLVRDSSVLLECFHKPRAEVAHKADNDCSADISLCLRALAFC